MKQRSRASIIATARAIEQLVLRGDGDAERNTALLRLEQYMTKHSITRDELGTGHVRQHVFRISAQWEWLFTHIVLHVLGNVKAFASVDGTEITVPCAAQDVPELWSMFERYQHAYVQYDLAMKQAFLERQQLYERPTPRHTADHTVTRTDTDAPEYDENVHGQKQPEAKQPKAKQPGAKQPENVGKKSTPHNHVPFNDPDDPSAFRHGFRLSVLRDMIALVPHYLPIGDSREEIPVTVL